MPFAYFYVFLCLFFSVGGGATTATQPCTPYCPGVSGFPDLECTHCQSLFHSKCVGIHQSVLERVRSTFRCRVSSRKIRQNIIAKCHFEYFFQICTPVQPRARGRNPASSGGSVTVIDLDWETKRLLLWAFLHFFSLFPLELCTWKVTVLTEYFNIHRKMWKSNKKKNYGIEHMIILK